MKIKFKVEQEFDAKILVVAAEVRYWEDASVNGQSDENGDLIPCRDGETWCPRIDIETGKILNWEQGKTAEVHYKVVDCCGWSIKDASGEVILYKEDGYVPSTLCPKESGYGDYIIMDIDENGFIQKWHFDIDDFIEDEE